MHIKISKLLLIMCQLNLSAHFRTTSLIAIISDDVILSQRLLRGYLLSEICEGELWNDLQEKNYWTCECYQETKAYSFPRAKNSVKINTQSPIIYRTSACIFKLLLLFQLIKAIARINIKSQVCLFMPHQVIVNKQQTTALNSPEKVHCINKCFCYLNS